MGIDCCLNCAKYDVRYACSQCHVATYCSRECQLARLANHGCKPTKKYLDGVNDTQWTIYERYQFNQDFNGKTRVLRKDGLVYKFCKTEREYLETIIFYESHQAEGIVPVIVTIVDNAWLIVSHLVDGFTLLSTPPGKYTSFSRDALQYALIIALSKFKRTEFGIDIVANLSNIAYDANSGRIVFYENNGIMYRYQRKSEMIFQCLQMIKFRESRLLGTIWNEETIERYCESAIERSDIADSQSL